MDILSKYPLDFTALEKGTTLEQLELEQIFSCTPDDKKWGLEMMRLAELIKLKAEILCRKSHNTLVLMDDAEAADYLYETKFLGGVRKMGGAVREVGLVNTSNMLGTAVAKFTSQCRIMAGTVQAARAKMKKLKRIEKLLELKSEAGAN